MIFRVCNLTHCIVWLLTDVCVHTTDATLFFSLFKCLRKKTTPLGWNRRNGVSYSNWIRQETFCDSSCSLDCVIWPKAPERSCKLTLSWHCLNNFIHSVLDFFKLNFDCLLSVVEVLLLAFILFQYYNCVSEMFKCFSYFVPCCKCASAQVDISSEGSGSWNRIKESLSLIVQYYMWLSLWGITAS